MSQLRPLRITGLIERNHLPPRSAGRTMGFETFIKAGLTVIAGCLFGLLFEGLWLVLSQPMQEITVCDEHGTKCERLYYNEGTSVSGLGVVIEPMRPGSGSGS